MDEREKVVWLSDTKLDGDNFCWGTKYFMSDTVGYTDIVLYVCVV